MQWFKNIFIYQLNKETNFSQATVESSLEPLRFQPCGNLDRSKMGWVSPFSEKNDVLSHQANGHILLCICKEDKILPAPVIKQRLQQKIDKLEQVQHKKLSKSEKESLKDETIHDLLPLAFSHLSYTWLWINTRDNLIMVNSASAKRAEDALSLLRKSLGSLPVTPLKIEPSPSIIFTQWVLTGKLPQHFTLLNEIELKSPDKEGAIISCKNQEIESDEILFHIKNGKLVTKIRLDWQDRVQFTLTDKACLKRVQYVNSQNNENYTTNNIDKEQQIDTDFILMSDEVSQLIKELLITLI